MIDDIKKLIDKENKRMTEQEDWYEFEFEILGYTAKAVRYTEYGHLCGYVKEDFKLSDEMYQALDDNAHGGITYDKENWIGFDCNHTWDFNLEWYYNFKENELSFDFETYSQEEVYRDLEYVIQTLKNMIVAMNNERMKQEKL